MRISVATTRSLRATANALLACSAENPISIQGEKRVPTTPHQGQARAVGSVTLLLLTDELLYIIRTNADVAPGLGHADRRRHASGRRHTRAEMGEGWRRRKVRCIRPGHGFGKSLYRRYRWPSPLSTYEGPRERAWGMPGGETDRDVGRVAPELLMAAEADTECPKPPCMGAAGWM